MSLTQWKADVVDRLAYGDGTTSGFGPGCVHREGVVDEKSLERFSDRNRNVKPYAVVWFGQRSKIRADLSSCGYRGSAYRMLLVVQACAYTGAMADQAVDLVSELLMGFRPDSQGELQEDSSMTIRRPMDMSGVRSMYAIPVAFNGIVDV